MSLPAAPACPASSARGPEAMARKSAVKTLPDEQRAFIEKLMRDDRHTLDVMIELIRAKFPSAQSPSRSSLGRYKQSFEEMAGRIRETQELARMMVTEFGEDADDKAGALLAQAVTTLATHAALDANDPDAKKLSVKEVGELARAARAVLQARTMSIKERQTIEAAGRAKLLQEQETRLEEVRGTDGMSEQLEDRIRRILLGKA